MEGPTSLECGRVDSDAPEASRRCVPPPQRTAFEHQGRRVLQRVIGQRMVLANWRFRRGAWWVCAFLVVFFSRRYSAAESVSVNLRRGPLAAEFPGNVQGSRAPSYKAG